MAMFHVVVATCIAAISLGHLVTANDPICTVVMNSDTQREQLKCGEEAWKESQAKKDEGVKMSHYQKCVEKLIGEKSDGKGGGTIDEKSVKKMYVNLPDEVVKSILEVCGDHVKAKKNYPTEPNLFRCAERKFAELHYEKCDSR